MSFILITFQRLCILGIVAGIIGLYLGFTDGFAGVNGAVAGIGFLTAALTGAVCYFFDDM